MEEENRQGRGLRFHLNDDGSRLQVEYLLDGPIVPVDFAWIKHTLDAQRSATGFFILEHAAGDIKKRYNEATEPFSIDIGEKRDGAFTVTLSSDRMSASLTLSPPYAGTPVALRSILENLTTLHIVSGVLHDRIQEALASGHEIENLLIAEGRPALHGENAQLLSLLPEAPMPAEYESENIDDANLAAADYRNISTVVSVKAGTPLMRRIPPTCGVNGEDVTGGPLAAEDGADVNFADNLSGAVIDPADPDLLIAEIAGMPLPVANGVTIEPVITVRNIDLSTGNLHFEGSVEVEGDIREGMELVVAGDVIVKGVVEAASITCGGSVTIMGGVIGHGLEAPHGKHLAEHAIIIAKGAVSALFVENAVIESAANIEIKELAMKSELTASGSIVIGEEGSKKGHLIGGVCRAGTEVRAIVAGSRASVPTRIEAGVDPTASERLDEVQQQITIRGKELEEIEKDRVYCHEHPDRFDAERSQQLENAYQELQARLAELFGQKKRLQRKLIPDPDACVAVERDVFQGVTIKIGDHLVTEDDDRFNGTFRIIDEQLAFVPNS